MCISLCTARLLTGNTFRVRSCGSLALLPQEIKGTAHSLTLYNKMIFIS